YECFGRRTAGVRLRLGFAPQSIEECDLLERPECAAAVDGQTVTFDLRPYEIKSFLIR
ncbi:MAG: hypothetical protein GX558_04415, partial [Clostridiales bacterium]|nr:hypothetical protein [Clostridiales bacterium]